MPRLRDCDPDFLDLDFLDVVEAFTSEKSVDIEALGLEPDEVAWWRSRKRKRQHKPTLASVAKQASKAEVEVARYEIRPDGTIVVVTGKSESTESNPWLADLNLKVTKQ
jgi:hypothetical protein